MDSQTPANIEDTSGITLAYALMILGFPLCFVPVFILSGLGMVMMLGSVVYTYRLKKRLQDKPIGANHVRWLIRTFWISSLYGVIGMIAALAVIQANADVTDIEQMRQALESQTATPDEVTLSMTQFYARNATLLYWSKILSFAPCLIFLAVRCIKGYSLSEKYQPVPNVKTWLI